LILKKTSNDHCVYFVASLTFVQSNNLIKPQRNIAQLRRVNYLEIDANTINLIVALVGFIIMFGYLGGIGINKPRGMSMKTWCAGYLAIAVVFDVLAVIGMAFGYTWLTYLLVGLAAGASTGLAFHVAHHISEENDHEHEHNPIMGM
jgi:hypothetical protein